MTGHALASIEFLYVSGIPFIVLRSPYCNNKNKAINTDPNKSHGMRNIELYY